MITFAYKWVFILIFLPFLLSISKKNKNIDNKALKVPFFKDITEFKAKKILNRISKITFLKSLIYLIWITLIIAAARPQIIGDKLPINQESRVIILVIDASGSMNERDFTLKGQAVSRFTATKAVVSDFIKKRKGDKIGIVLFGTNAYIYAPPSNDTKTLLYLLDTTKQGLVGNNTAIGDGLAMAVQMVQNLPEQNRIAILLSDGISNTGSLSNEEALDIAIQNHLQIYTIAIGSNIINQFFGIPAFGNLSIDKQALEIISQKTGGQSYTAENTQELQNIYNEIDRQKPIKDQENFFQIKTELFYIPLAIVLILSIILVIVIKDKKHV